MLKTLIWIFLLKLCNLLIFCYFIVIKMLGFMLCSAGGSSMFQLLQAPSDFSILLQSIDFYHDAFVNLFCKILCEFNINHKARLYCIRILLRIWIRFPQPCSINDCFQCIWLAQLHGMCTLSVPEQSIGQWRICDFITLSWFWSCTLYYK